MKLLVAFALGLALMGLVACAAPAPQAQTLGELRITMATEPAPPLVDRTTRLIIDVERGETALEGARVLVVRRMLGMEHPGDDTVFESQDLGGGRYVAETTFVMGGRWDVQLIVTPPGGTADTATFVINVEQP